MEGTPSSPDVSPWIDINGVKHEILCGHCREPITFRSEPDSQTDKAGCVMCDNFADLQQVAGVAIASATNKALQALYDCVEDDLRGRESMTTSSDSAYRSYAFVIDLEL